MNKFQTTIPHEEHFFLKIKKKIQNKSNTRFKINFFCKQQNIPHILNQQTFYNNIQYKFLNFYSQSPYKPTSTSEQHKFKIWTNSLPNPHNETQKTAQPHIEILTPFPPTSIFP